MNNDNQIIKLYEHTRKTIKNYWNNGKINIIVVGKTGVGKTTLINSVFQKDFGHDGKRTPITRNIKKVTEEGSIVSIYDTEGLEIIKYEKITQEINGFLEEKKNSLDINEHIHVAWFCVYESRIENAEIKMINEISKLIPTIVIITKNQFIDDDECKKYIELIKNECGNIKDVIRVRAKSYSLENGVTLPPLNLLKLVELTNKVLPEGVRNAFIATQNISFDIKKKKGNGIIKINSLISLITGLIPIPYDAMILLLIEIEMIIVISYYFGFSLFDIITILFFEIGGIILHSLIKKIILIYVLKLIPNIAIVFILLFSFISYASTKKYGKFYMNTITMAYKNKKGDFITINDIKNVDKTSLEKSLNEELMDITKKMKNNTKDIAKYIINDIKETIKEFIWDIVIEIFGQSMVNGTDRIKKFFEKRENNRKVKNNSKND